MSILLINGARNVRGQTARAALALAQGLGEAGREIEHVYLPALNIGRCRQCGEDGWGDCRTRGACVIEDDFASLLAKVRDAQAVVFATPVYYGDLSESLRAFLDRLRRVTWRIPESRAWVEGKKALGICVAGGGGGGSAACALSLEKILQNCRMEVLDLVLVRRQNHDLKLEVLQVTGRWLARALV